jgi:phenylalanyl-tRNA synthetase beta chain
MKLSLSWIFDHIDADWEKQNVDHITSLFNKITAEIEHYYPISHNLDDFYVATAQALTSKNLFIQELSKEITLSPRNNEFDLIGSHQRDICYFIKKSENQTFSWATLQDFNLDKHGLFPSIDVPEKDIQGSWRNAFQRKDIIFEVDNKSITHRPDLWCHRGFAREIAAFLNLNFIDKKAQGMFDITLPIKNFDNISQETKSCPFIIKNEASGACNKFSGLYIPSIENKASSIFITSRLINVGSRPLNGIIDLTNYVMLDMSQPVHAYDAEKVAKKTVVVRQAKNKELLPLLDGTTAELTQEDLVIADSEKPIGLAGIKGGLEDSISEKTTSVFFESANFDPVTIRKTSLRQKIKTDSSSRFEKTLDKNQCEDAIIRFLSLCKQVGIKVTTAQEIVTVGANQEEVTILVHHSFLEKHIGKTLPPDEVCALLEKLEFKITQTKEKNGVVYNITVPSFRASKDISSQEDILEEVVRTYGFENIMITVPKIQSSPFDLEPMKRKRAIFQHLAFAEKMIEQQNYALYDEAFLSKLELELPTAISIKNPVSENFYILRGSLFPGLLKNIDDNIVHKDFLRFFEFGKVWRKSKKDVSEIEVISGIIFAKRGNIDFYEGKDIIVNTLVTLGYSFSSTNWKKLSHENVWYHPYQTAEIFYNDQKIGIAGIINNALLQKIHVIPESNAFIFELDTNFLFTNNMPTKTYQLISKYQEIFFDLSMLTPLKITMEQLQKTLYEVDANIRSVELVDFFEKKEWTDKKSITLRLWLEKRDSTYEKEEITAIWEKAIKTIEKMGITIRS